MIAFEHEMAAARSAGVKNPDNLPFLLLPTASNGQSVLLVHGFCATPYEMRPLAEHLCQQGFTTLGVRLPGHGTSPEDLATRRAEEWLTAVERGYQILSQLKLPISAVGLSTGALLLMQLAQLQPLTKLVLLSPFLNLKHPLANFAWPLCYLSPYQKRTLPEAEHPYHYQRRPLKGVAQINRIRSQIKTQLARITTPILLLASQGDKTIATGTVEELFAGLGSKEKQLHSYGQEVPHALTADTNPQQQDVFKRVAEYLSSEFINTSGS